jgi:hypothetical protein
MRRCLTVIVVAAAMSLSVPALADCPPDAWFCAEVKVPAPAPAQPRPRLQPEEAPPPAPYAPAPLPQRPPPAPAVAPPPVVIYQPVPRPAAPVIVVTPGYVYGYGDYGAYAPRPPAFSLPPPAPRWHPELGINLRLEGIALGHPNGAPFSAGLGGAGLSLRYRPVPHFAFDLGADVLAGTDYNGFRRTEVPVSLSGLLYVNPRSRVQFYLEAGANVSRAEVRSDVAAPQLAPVDGGRFGATYTYFGGQGGGGLEVRFSQHVATDLAVLGFVRDRIGDVGAPEFVDPTTGKTTNVSGGALFRGGLTFWW